MSNTNTNSMTKEEQIEWINTVEICYHGRGECCERHADRCKDCQIKVDECIECVDSIKVNNEMILNENGSYSLNEQQIEFIAILFEKREKGEELNKYEIQVIEMTEKKLEEMD